MQEGISTQLAQKRDQACSVLLLSIEPEWLAPVLGMRNPKNIFHTLEQIFKSSPDPNFQALLIQYQEIEMTDDEIIMQYVNRVVEI